MALGFDGHVALVNVPRDNPVGNSFLLLIRYNHVYASTLTFGLPAPTPNTPETHQKLSKDGLS